MSALYYLTYLYLSLIVLGIVLTGIGIKIIFNSKNEKTLEESDSIPPRNL